MDEAMYGLSLSYGTDISKMEKVADGLAWKDGGHNKFLESIIVAIDIDAPRYWWSQFDTYRIGVTKQSESTMHTLMERELTFLDFCPGVSAISISVVNKYIRAKDFMAAKVNLPEGFLQQRVVVLSYMSLRRMRKQRYNHKLEEWRVLCDNIASQVTKPQWIIETKGV